MTLTGGAAMEIAMPAVRNAAQVNALGAGVGEISCSTSSFCRMQQRREKSPSLAWRGRRAIASAIDLRSDSAVSSNGVAAATLIPTPTKDLSSGASDDPPFGILYSENFTIRCYEVGTNKKASIQTIANLLQEVACNQVRTLGFSTDGFATTLSMRKHHLIWVTVRMHIEMDDYPNWGDAVQAQTWFQENRNGTRRDWLLKDVNTGLTLGRATSTWVMMNQETRRFARINEEIRGEYHQYALDPPRFSFPEDHATYKKHQLAKLENAEHHITGLKPRRADLDMNQHVNNVAYIGWMMESLPADIANSHELRGIILEFKQECKHDDCVESMAAKFSPADQSGDEEHQFLHLLRLDGSSREINRGWTHWVKAKESSQQGA
ncbi:oleoyl-acyl carrier protein thioesterase 1, chloroplastic [Selaginella moellendorffii]|nr:oleoyl-acyl carrier protein thioesterase 1, chloroplastic [Selaginella moellendorffii]|eukprot:XP_002992591.2 oleoyl-acyl carrier protein thioesterase 1, chloroplastic [Selaginella moellendorffii]